MYPGGDELETPDVTSVMRGKMHHVREELQKIDALPKEPALILAADTRTATVMIQDREHGAPRVGLVSRGKPKNEAVVKETFRTMADFAHRTRQSPMYMVESASGSLLLDLDEERKMKRFCVIELLPSAVKYFSQDKGFLEYRNAFNSFYRSQVYVEEGIAPMTMMDLSGGLSLPVLVQLGAVRSIDRVSIDHPAFKNIFRQALFTVAIGFSPEVWGGKRERTVNGWPWVDKVVTHALESR